LIRGRVVIDTSNPFVGRDGEIASWAREKGAGLASAELLPGARLVRAFNAIGAARMGEAHKEPGPDRRDAEVNLNGASGRIHIPAIASP